MSATRLSRAGLFGARTDLPVLKPFLPGTAGAWESGMSWVFPSTAGSDWSCFWRLQDG